MFQVQWGKTAFVSGLRQEVQGNVTRVKGKKHVIATGDLNSVVATFWLWIEFASYSTSVHIMRVKFVVTLMRRLVNILEQSGEQRAPTIASVYLTSSIWRPRHSFTTHWWLSVRIQAEPCCRILYVSTLTVLTLYLPTAPPNYHRNVIITAISKTFLSHYIVHLRAFKKKSVK